ncbi:hypothetical protein J2S55_000725 [Streptosporangium brasiliense]|uniref:Uncharacterized protein n=1 Tax=Streptosporangium brasiliense TaxID=47480 RepID=A0ABT9QWX6_9ACTN|nr:hypothetical protein [Streptosporangium brasiliense]
MIRTVPRPEVPAARVAAEEVPVVRVAPSPEEPTIKTVLRPGRGR